MKKAVFLDRDGVINLDHGYVYQPDNFDFMPGIFSLLRDLQKKKFLLFIVTNQSGIGRGYYTEEDFQLLTNWMLAEFKKEGIDITKVYHCPHTPTDNCTCRKPHPKFILDAIKNYTLNPKDSYMLGDKESDMEAAKNASIENRILISDKKASTSAATRHVSELTEIHTLL